MSGLTSTAYTRPVGPTWRAKRSVKYPDPAPMSATCSPPVRPRAATTSAGFCHASRAGSSREAMYAFGSACRRWTSSTVGGLRGGAG